MDTQATADTQPVSDPASGHVVSRLRRAKSVPLYAKRMENIVTRNYINTSWRPHGANGKNTKNDALHGFREEYMLSLKFRYCLKQ